MVDFLKKHYSNILFGFAIVLLLHPTSKAYILRLISFSPSIESKENRVQISTYHWNLHGLNTEDYDFNQAKGKVVLVNFWATSCMPCVAEMPSIEDLYQDYGDKVAFILVTRESKDKIAPFMAARGFTLPIYNSASTAPVEFDTNTIPRTFLLNKKGEIVIDAGRADWNTTKIRTYIDELLAE